MKNFLSKRMMLMVGCMGCSVSNLMASIDRGHTSRQRIGVTDGSSQPLSAYGLLNGRFQLEAADGKFGLAIYGTDQGDVARAREIGVTFSAEF